MTEKEERIYIRGYGENNPCDTCEDTSGDECDSCMENYEWNASIPRKEVINRMAKALCKFEMMTVSHLCKECSEECFDHLELEVVDKAEAALNALLEKE